MPATWWGVVALTHSPATSCPDARVPYQPPYSKRPLIFWKPTSSSEPCLPCLKTEAVEPELTSMVIEWSSSVPSPHGRGMRDPGPSRRLASVALPTKGAFQEAVLSEWSWASSRDPVQGLPRSLGPQYFQGLRKYFHFFPFFFFPFRRKKWIDNHKSSQG